MRNRNSLNKFLRTDRKTLYMVLSIVIISVLTLTVVYAALSTTLNITGNAEVTAASWDIYLNNIKLNSSSATTTSPTISNKTTASFSTTLTEPGDFYEFTVDVINNGTIDAMIDSVTKTPTLTTSQAKYLNYIVEYENGENITTKQLVSKNSFVRLKVKVEFRKDLSSSDLPTQSETLNLAFTVNYTQADETGTNVTDNGEKKAYSIVSGDLETPGSIVAIGNEQFYVIKKENEKVKLLSAYNLTKDEVPMQNSSTSGIPFSSTAYWSDGSNLKSQYGTGYPAYVYDSNSTIYNYIENYKIYLESQGAEIEEARVIKIEELEELGCSVENATCSNAPSWVTSSAYWTGSAYSDNEFWYVVRFGGFAHGNYSSDFVIGAKPVIVLIQ